MGSSGDAAAASPVWRGHVNGVCCFPPLMCVLDRIDARTPLSLSPSLLPLHYVPTPCWHPNSRADEQLSAARNQSLWISMLPWSLNHAHRLAFSPPPSCPRPVLRRCRCTRQCVPPRVSPGACVAFPFPFPFCFLRTKSVVAQYRNVRISRQLLCALRPATSSISSEPCAAHGAKQWRHADHS